MIFNNRYVKIFKLTIQTQIFLDNKKTKNSTNQVKDMQIQQKSLPLILQAII